MLRSMVRSSAPLSPVATVAVSVPTKTTAEEPAEEAAEPEPIILNRRVASSGASLRDELTAMVREDPDAAANVLRNWIGDAA